jgi:hypothetical protein
VVRRQGYNLHAAAGEVCVASDEECVEALALKGDKDRIDLLAGAGVEDVNLRSSPDRVGENGLIVAS